MSRVKSRPERPEYDKAVFMVLHAVKGVSATKLASQTYVSASTIAKWRRGPKFGGTRYPQHHTLAAVAALAGLKWTLVSDVRRPREKPTEGVSLAR